MFRKVLLILICGLIPLPAMAGSVGTATVEPAAVVGVCGISPVLSRTCMAVEVPLSATEALAGWRWYNNDGTLPFPTVLVLAGEPGTVPSLDGTSVALLTVYGGSSAWSDQSLAAPVTSESGALYVVFEMPAFQERTGTGEGGGPGFGLLAEPVGVSQHISLTGCEWTSAACNLAFVPLKVAREPGMAVLSASTGDEPEPAQVFAENGFAGVSPNPFNPVTRLRFGLREAGWARLTIYNLRGQRVTTLVDGELPAGYHEREWRGEDGRGHPQASGLYVARLATAGQVFTQRLSLVK